MPLLQKNEFLRGEGDAYMERNRTTLKEVPADDPLSVHIREHMADEGRLLEIGCANGARLASVIAHRSLEGYGIDPSGLAIHEGSKRFPRLKLSVGVADKLPFEDGFFSAVMCGFCLYLVDRESLTKVVAEVDRVLVTGGNLIIWDFDPVVNYRNPYKHKLGLYSYKMDYSRMWTGFPHFSLIMKLPFSHAEFRFTEDVNERLAMWVIHKEGADAGFPLIAT